MCGAQFGTGEYNWPFTVVFCSWFCFTGQTVLRNNADIVIIKFTCECVCVCGGVWVRESERAHSYYCHASYYNQILSYHRSRAHRRGI